MEVLLEVPNPSKRGKNRFKTDENWVESALKRTCHAEGRGFESRRPRQYYQALSSQG